MHTAVARHVEIDRPPEKRPHTRGVEAPGPAREEPLAACARLLASPRAGVRLDRKEFALLDHAAVGELALVRGNVCESLLDAACGQGRARFIEEPVLRDASLGGVRDGRRCARTRRTRRRRR